MTPDQIKLCDEFMTDLNVMLDAHRLPPTASALALAVLYALTPRPFAETARQSLDEIVKAREVVADGQPYKSNRGLPCGWVEGGEPDHGRAEGEYPPLSENRIKTILLLIDRYGGMAKNLARAIERQVIAPAIEAARTPAGAKPHITKSTIMAAMEKHLRIDNVGGALLGNGDKSFTVGLRGKEAAADAILFALYGDAWKL